MAAPAVEAVVGVATLALIGLLYLASALLGARRDVAVLPRLLQLNVLAGWTLVGWCYCLYLAACCPPRPATTGYGRVRDERAWAAAARRTAPFLPNSMEKR